uniref:Uncharacterized protein n=1 Tax=Solanum lycopersicum TaxID=4081 RepID=A0A3Q7FN47_SOLLC
MIWIEETVLDTSIFFLVTILSMQSLEEARAALQVAKPTILVHDATGNFWKSESYADSVASLRWQVLMDTPCELHSTNIGLTTEQLKRSCERRLTADYLWAPKEAAIICFTSGIY